MNIDQIKGIICQTEIADYMRDGMALSEPVPIPGEEGFREGGFAYYVDVRKDLMSPPCFYFLLDLSCRRVVSIKRNDKGKDRGTDIVISGEEIQERRKAGKIYKELYPEVRPLFFREIQSPEQREKIRMFYNAFRSFIGEGKIPFYREAAPEYFAWLERIINEE